MIVKKHPSFFKVPEGVEVSSKPHPDLEGASVHEVHQKDDILGTVHVFDAGLGARGSKKKGVVLPFSISDLVSSNGIKLLADLSGAKAGPKSLENYVPYLGVARGLNPWDVRNARETAQELFLQAGGAVGAEIMGRTWFGDPESFRRHVLAWEKNSFTDFKIPGKKVSHAQLSTQNFHAPVQVYQLFQANGVQPLMGCPIMLVEIPPTFTPMLYGLQPSLTGRQRKSLCFAVYEHLDGRRIIQRGWGSHYKSGLLSLEYVRRVSGENGKEFEDVISDMLRTPFNVLSAAHEAGVALGRDRHYGNYVLCADAVTRAAPDMGNAKKLDPKDGRAKSRLIEDDLKSMAFHFKRIENAVRRLLGKSFVVDDPWIAYHLDPSAMKKQLGKLRMYA